MTLATLRRMEWGCADGICPCCGAFSSDGHATDCELSADIRRQEAGETMPPIEVGDWVHYDASSLVDIVKNDYDVREWQKALDDIDEIRKTNGYRWTREPR